MKESMAMAIFDRFNIKVVAAAAGLCGVAIALRPVVAAAPLKTGGYECLQTSAGGAGGALPAGGGAGGGLPAAGGAGGASPGGAGGAAPGCVPASAPHS